MADLNLTVVQGRLCADPELRQTGSGKYVCSFSVAVNSYSGGQSKADFFTVVCWDKTASLVANYFKKGSQILVRGRLTSRKYEKDGASRTAIEITADEVCFCGSKAENNPYAATAAQAYAPTEMPKFEPVGSEEDLPF